MNQKQLIITIVIALLVGAAAGGGVWYWQNQKNKRLENQISDLKKQVESLKGGSNSGETSENDLTKDWKTYESKEYGYSIKYPKDWYFKDNIIKNWKSQETGEGGLDKNMARVDLLPVRSVITSLEAFVENEIKAMEEFAVKITKQEKMTVNSLEGIKIEGAFEDDAVIFITFYLLKDNKIYTISAYAGAGTSEKIQETLDNILNSVVI